MARLNVAERFPQLVTNEGAPAKSISPTEQLRRSVMNCLLFEKEFYDNGVDIATRIRDLIPQVPVEDVCEIAVEAREDMNLRHVPLLIAAALVQQARGTPYARAAGNLIGQVIQRADELGEFLAITMSLNGIGRDQLTKKLAHQAKRGLGEAIKKFDRYEISKYSSKHRAGEIRPIDVLRIVHPKPKDAEQAALWQAVTKGTLEPPATWEVQLSKGSDKREVFTRLIQESKLGYLALLRNLRGMAEAGVDAALIEEAILVRRGARRVLPFRYVAAARAAPQFEPALDAALRDCILESPPLLGKTLVLVDVSGSMHVKLSRKSDTTRMDAASALASLIHGDRRVFSFSADITEVPARYGMAGIDAIQASQLHASTMLGAAVRRLNTIPADRLIVVTDEQSQDAVPDPVHRHAFLINVASAKNGVGYHGRWNHINGFSEHVIRWILQAEKQVDSSDR